MIRFACPSCQAVFSVADEKGGKTGKCPKCQAQFIVPNAEPSAAPDTPPLPPPPPPPAIESNDVEIKPCPGCQAKLTVEKTDLGLDVECPYCKTQYTAIAANAAEGASSKVSLRDDRDDDDDKPKRKSSSRRDDDDDDDDRPRRKKDRFGEDRDDEDDDGYDRPRKKRRRRRVEHTAAVTGVAIFSFILGVLSFLCSFCMLGLGGTIKGLMAQANARNGGGGNGGIDPDTLTMILIVLGVVYLIVAILLIVGGIGLQQRKAYGRYVTFATATIAFLLAIFQIVNIITSLDGPPAPICGGAFATLLWGSFGTYAMIVMFTRGEEFE